MTSRKGIARKVYTVEFTSDEETFLAHTEEWMKSLDFMEDRLDSRDIGDAFRAWIQIAEYEDWESMTLPMANGKTMTFSSHMELFEWCNE